MFKLSQSPTFFWPVEVSLPTDGGKYTKETFDAQFERLSQTQLRELNEQIEAGKLTDSEFVRQVLKGWRGVTDDGNELPFSPTTLDQLLDVPTVASSIVMAFIKAHQGVTRKN